MEFDFLRLEYFVKSAEMLNFTAAAKKLYISPQALNKQIAKLEQEVGSPLFDRTTRKVELTEDGKKLYDTFAPLVREYRSACTSFEKYQKKKKSILRVGYFQVIPKSSVIQLIVQELKVLDRSLNIQIQAGELDDIRDWLADGSIDLAITNIHEFEEWPKKYERIELFSSPAMLVTSLYHPWMVKEGPITAQDMASQPIILMRKRKDMEDDSFYRNVLAEDIAYTPNFYSMIMNLENGNYYAVFPRMFEQMDKERLQYYELPKEYAFQFWMVMMYAPNSRFAERFREIGNNLDDIDLSLKGDK